MRRCNLCVVVAYLLRMILVSAAVVLLPVVMTVILLLRLIRIMRIRRVMVLTIRRMGVKGGLNGVRRVRVEEG